jgi:CHAD domain-containing protein
LSRRARKIIKKVKRIEHLQPRQQHKLRIAVKKLRYASQFFASLFDNKAAKSRGRLERRLKALQSALGKLNDIRVHLDLAGQFAKPEHRAARMPQKAFAIGTFGRQRADERCLAGRAGAPRRQAEFAKASAFWR